MVNSVTPIGNPIRTILFIQLKDTIFLNKTFMFDIPHVLVPVIMGHVLLPCNRKFFNYMIARKAPEVPAPVYVDTGNSR